MYLLTRRNKFLNDRYQWTDEPHLFPEWQFGDVLELSMQFKDRPQQVGEVVNGQVVFTRLT